MSLSSATHAPASTGFGTELRVTAVYAVSGALALLLQTTLFHSLTGGRIIPDLVLVLCVYLGLHEHNVGGATGAFLLGYMLDSFSGSLVGLNAFAMTAVYLVSYLMSRRLWLDNAFSGVAMVFLGTLLKGVAVVGALAAYLAVDRLSLGAVERLLAEAVIAAALTPVVFAVIAWEKRAVGVS
jgi:rod shape-determining protein MreD